MTEAGGNEHAELLQRALVALDEMEADLRASEARQHEPIAVVGMGVRLPGGANDPDAFWDLLSSGRDGVTEIPADRWNVDGMFDPDPGTPGKSYTRWGGFLDGIDRFDATLFGISPREAVSMDPQQRLLLEVAWETFEHAGVASADVAGSATGVFLGVVSSDYSDLALQGGVIDAVDPYFASGVAQSVAAGRLAYTFDLHGPALTVDTACSSSAYATHLAIQALRNRECDAALAGGVSLMVSPDGHIMTSQAKMMSFEGRCKTFDAGADGYVRGEGCALVYLKRLSDAVEAGDEVLAVLRGSAVNQDGRSNGLTAPSATAQEAVIRRALTDGGVDPADVDVVECHGTGTTLGDPIEVRALEAVFGPDRPSDRPLRIQSVKTNIGHLEGTAGVAGLCKLILSLSHAELPRHLHLNEPNPYIDWDRISVVPEAGPWVWDRHDDSARIGGLSSFGFSGTNVHLVVEAAASHGPDSTSAPTGRRVPQRPWRVHVTSGRTADATAANAEAHAGAVEMRPAAWRSSSLTSTLGRTHLDQRVAVVAHDAASVIAGLRTFATGESSDDVLAGRRGNVSDGVVMMFAGQGSQRPEMGRLLYASEPVFRARFDECDALFSDLMGTSLSKLVFDGDDATLNDTRHAQPGLFSIEVALVALWQSWGIDPVAVLGHSIGEIAAAYVAGVMSLADAVVLVEARGRLMGALPREGAARGVMAAVFADVATVRAAIGDRADVVSIAAENGPRNTVISGRVDAVEEVITVLETDGLRVIRLDVSHAFHSPLMEPMLDDFSAVLDTITLHEPRIDVISNRTGMVAEPGELTDPTYWRDHVRDPVRFEASIGHAVDLGYRCLLEVGPDSTLTAMAQPCTGGVEMLTVSSLRKGVDDDRSLQRAVAALHVGGVDIDWPAYEATHLESAERAALPTYRFDRQRFWHDAVNADKRGHRSTVDSSARPETYVGARLASPSLSDVVFERDVDASAPAWLAEHVIHGATVVPATAFNEFMYQAAQLALGDIDGLADIAIIESLVLDDGIVTVQTIVSPADDVTVVSYDGDDWTTHARGRVVRRDDGVADDSPDTRSSTWTESVWTRCDHAVEGEEYYDALVRLGVEYGPLFRNIVRAGRRAGEVVAVLDAGDPDGHHFDVHPALADACLQSLGLALPGGADLRGTSNDVYMPVGVDRWTVHGVAVGELTVHGRVRGDVEDDDVQPEVAVGDLELVADDGCVVAAAEGVRFKRVNRSLLRPVEHRRIDNLYTPLWRAAPLSAVASERADRWLVAGPIAAAAQLRDRLGEPSSVIELATDAAPVDPLITEVLSSLDGQVDGIVIVLPSDFTPHWSIPAWVAEVAVGLGPHPGVALTIVTSGSAAVVHGDAVPGAAHAANWGVGRVAANEIPQLNVRMIDVEPLDTAPAEAGTAWIDQVASELRVTGPDSEIAWRDGVRYAQRLVRSTDTGALPVPPNRYELVAGDRGRLDAVHFVDQEPFDVGPGEVLIDVRATGLNFRDVLNVLGQYAGDASTLGGECAGRVLAVGQGVTRVAVGDRVMAIADRSFARQCVVDEHMVMRQPIGCTDAEAATIPIAFGTARYGLRHLAALGNGDRVLIHAATGGVGSAAVQLAQQAGAEIFATAGSPHKRAELRSIGVAHVYDSRSIDFRDEILRDTGGAGVDVVLNSLTGDAIGASVDVLAADGRFIEIGMAGIWDEATFAEHRPGAIYHVLFLGQVCRDDPQEIASMLDGLTADLAAGELRPLRLVAFDIRHSVEAFRYMAQAKHIGKVVVTASPGWNIASSTGAWIISGGLGGLGLTIARQLAESGAQRIVLCSRRAATGDTADLVADIATICPDVRVRSLDVADRAEVDAMVAETVADGTELAGVIHTAGVIDDGLLRDLDPSRFDTVRRPKVDGARHLVAACDSHHPDHVVFFSAGAVLFGSQTQANYAAANAELDALAHQRRAAGLPAQTINWGPWRDVGMAAALGDEAMRRWEAQGILGITPAAGTAALRAVIERGDVQTAVLDLRWSALLHHFSKHSVPPLLDELARSQKRGSVIDVEVESGFVQQLLEVDVAQRPGLLRKLIRKEVFDVLGLDSEHPVSSQDGLSEVGMDSLMAVELSNRLTVLIDHTLASTVAFEHSTLDALGAYVTELLAQDVDFEQARVEEDSSEFDGLSASELTDALLAELDDSGY